LWAPRGGHLAKDILTNIRRLRTALGELTVYLLLQASPCPHGVSAEARASLLPANCPWLHHADVRSITFLREPVTVAKGTDKLTLSDDMLALVELGARPA
jgi:hypothetical protein